MVVIGGRNSSNTTRLAEVCAAHLPAHLPHRIGRRAGSGRPLPVARRVGVTAGASTPENQIAAVEAFLRSAVAMATYPGKDIEREACRVPLASPVDQASLTAAAGGGCGVARGAGGALIVAVEPESPADDAGFDARLLPHDGGRRIPCATSSTGAGLRPTTSIVRGLHRSRRRGRARWSWSASRGSGWGFEFDGVRVRRREAVPQRLRVLLHAPAARRRAPLARAARRRLPPELSRRAPSSRFTNLKPEDEARIIEQRISAPARVACTRASRSVRRRIDRQARRPRPGRARPPAGGRHRGSTPRSCSCPA